MEEVKMFLFSRWLATSYADEHLDKNMKHSSQEGYTGVDELSVLNRQNGNWYKEQIYYFNNVVYPTYLKDGSVKNIKIFLNIPDNE